MNHRSIHQLAAVFAVAISLGFALAPTLRADSFPPLNDPATNLQIPGKFIWADLFTNQPDTAATFYCGLFGWTSAPVEQHDKSYIILSNDGHPVAGVVQRSAESTKTEGVWVNYISVKKAKATLKLVEPAGGELHASAHKFPNRGIQAIFTDSEGSVVGILQSSSGDPLDNEPARGDWNWFELFSLKPKATADFYGQVIGYDVSPDTRSEKSGHFLLSAAGHARAGVASLPASPDSRSGWLGCVRVDNVDDAAAKAVTLGGTVVVPPRPAALGSRFAVVTDPTGGAVGLVQYVDNANPANRP